jgi:hypothetical protein
MKFAPALFLCAALANPLCLQAETDPPVSVLRLRIEGMEEDAEEFPVISLVSLDSGVTEKIPMRSVCEELELEKGGEYAVSLTDVPAGLMPDREVFLYFSETMADSEKVITLRPFEVKIFQKIQDTDISAEGGILQMSDEKDEPLFEFVPDPEGKILDEEGNEIKLQAGRGYILSQKEPAPGFQDGGDLLMIIPEYMEETDEPIEITYSLTAAPPYIEPVTPAQGEWGGELLIPKAPEDPFETKAVEKKEETETAGEEKREDIRNVSWSAPSYVAHTIGTAGEPEKKETAVPNKKTGFLIRMTDPGHQYLSGASLAVYDSQGNPVDAWISASEDHLVAGDKVREGETYTIRLIKAAEGYAADTLAIEHTALSLADGRYPVIEMSDHPKTEVKEVTETQKIRKTADWLVIASSVIAAAAIGALIWTTVRKPHPKTK